MRRWKTAMLAWALALFAPAHAQEASPGPAPTHADIAYAPADPAGSAGHLLDLYLPAPGARPVPVVLWTAGSAWRSDKGKERADWLVRQLVPHGYAVAAVSVRSSAQARFPAQAQDIKAAIRWLKANAAQYGLDANHVGIIGTSSGGWATAMAATTADVPVLEGKGPSSRVQAAIAFWPPAEFLAMDAHNFAPCGEGASGPGATCHDDAGSPESTLIGCALQTCPDKANAASPVAYASKTDTPILIINGKNDRLVPADQGARLFAAYAKACGEATYINVPGLGHGPLPAYFDAAKNQGATIRTVQGCSASAAAPTTLTAATLLAFLDAKLKP